MNVVVKLTVDTFRNEAEERQSRILNDLQKTSILNIMTQYVQDMVNIPTAEDKDGLKREFARGSIASLQYLLDLDANARTSIPNDNSTDE